MTEKLLPCPFCGKQVAIIDTCHELEDCANFERCGDGGYCSVVCSVNRGGCGASAGYARTEREAINRWNRRADHSGEASEMVGGSDATADTRAERIRGMSDEELARQNVRKLRGYCVWTTSDGREFTSYLGFGCGYRADEDTIALAVQHELDWLRQPAGTEGTE